MLTFTACGVAEFTQEIRQTLLKTMSEKIIELAEVEYRPQELPIHPRVRSAYLQDQENTTQEASSGRRLRAKGVYISSPLASQISNTAI